MSVVHERESGNEHDESAVFLGIMDLFCECLAVYFLFKIFHFVFSSLLQFFTLQLSCSLALTTFFLHQFSFDVCAFWGYIVSILNIKSTSLERRCKKNAMVCFFFFSINKVLQISLLALVKEHLLKLSGKK